MRDKIKYSRIIFRVTTDKHEEIRETARRLGLSISEYFRALHEGVKDNDSLKVEVQERRVALVSG